MHACEFTFVYGHLSMVSMVVPMFVSALARKYMYVHMQSL